MKKFLLVAALIAAMFVLAGCSGRVYEFGYVDTQKIFEESPKLKAAQEQFEAKVKEMQALDEKEQGTLSEEDFNKNRQMRGSELMTLQKEIETQFMTSLNTAMDEVAKEKKLGAILVKGGVMHGGVDVTEEVLQRIK